MATQKPLEAPEWLFKHSSYGTEKLRKKKEREIKPLFPASSESNPDLFRKFYSEPSTAGNKNIQLDTDSQFSSDESSPLEEEKCDRCAQQGLTCDSDDPCEQCEKHQSSCSYAADIARQAELEKEGREGAQEAFAQRAAIPPEIARTAAYASRYFRKVWTSGRKPSLVREIERTNEYIERQGRLSQVQNPKAYRIPEVAILEAICLLHDDLLLWPTVESDPKARANVARDCLTLCLSIARSLDNCGLAWKMIVDPQVYRFLQQVFEITSPQLSPDILQMLQAYVKRDLQATTFQVDKAQRATRDIQKYFQALGQSGEESELKNSATNIEDVNREISTENRNVGFREEDHLLPIEWFQNKEPELRGLTDEQTSLKVKSLQSSMLRFLDEAGYYQIKETLQSQWNVDIASITLGEDFVRYLEEQKFLWRTPFAPEQDKTIVSRARSSSAISTEKNTVKTSEVTTAVGPPLANGIPGPNYDNGTCPLGKIEQVRRAGGSRGGYRIIVNAGCEMCPIYEVINGGDCGRGMGEALFAQFGQKEGAPIKDRKPMHIERFGGMARSEQRPGAVREPVTYFLIHWHKNAQRNPYAQRHDLREWITRSDVISIMGKKQVDSAQGLSPRLTAQRIEKVQWLVKCKQEKINPDTGAQIDQKAIQCYPWLFPNEIHTSARQIEDVPMPDAPPIIESWSPPTVQPNKSPGATTAPLVSTVEEVEEEKEENPGPISPSKMQSERLLN